jgi:AAA15 family ATPase/GTPase
MTKKTDFKLIALRPHKDCAERYSKILVRGELYYFYNNYQVGVDDHIKRTGGLESDFFLQSESTWVNLSAIVGKNGSGKSTIIELLFMALNNLAAGQPLTQKLLKVDGLHVDIYIILGDIIKLKRGSKLKFTLIQREKEMAPRSKNLISKISFILSSSITRNMRTMTTGSKQERVG